MTSTVRVLIAALVITVAAAGGTFALGLKASAGADAFANGPQVGTSSGTQLVSTAFKQVERVYYKPFSAQLLLNGERKSLIAALTKAHVAGVTLPQYSIAGDNTTGDGSVAAGMLATAQKRFAVKVGANGDRTLTEAALSGILNANGDPYTVYLTPREIQSLNEQLDGGDFGGVGVYIEQLRDGRIVLLPIEDLPAYHAGMKAPEILTAVDGKSVKGITIDTVQGLIRGPVGSVVRLATYPYSKPSAKKTFAIARQTILVPTVHAKRENNIEYIRLSDFGQTSAAEIKKALLDGRAHNVKGYILDLRDNGGGLVTAAVDISSYFIKSGTIVSTIDRNGSRNDETANGTAIAGLGPLVILVNKYTASASEITSGALQDYHLATLIGTKTFGKGIVQSIYPMQDGGALKITTQRYVTPMGRDIQHRGIQPDILVPQDADDPRLIDSPADKQLQAAKARLAQLAR